MRAGRDLKSVLHLSPEQFSPSTLPHAPTYSLWYEPAPERNGELLSAQQSGCPVAGWVAGTNRYSTWGTWGRTPGCSVSTVCACELLLSPCPNTHTTPPPSHPARATAVSDEVPASGKDGAELKARLVGTYQKMYAETLHRKWSQPLMQKCKATALIFSYLILGLFKKKKKKLVLFKGDKINPHPRRSVYYLNPVYKEKTM